jgi:hypothetical protein
MGLRGRSQPTHGRAPYYCSVNLDELTARDSIAFERPPVVRAEYVLRFRPSERLKLVHVGAVLSRWASEFPVVNEYAPDLADDSPVRFEVGEANWPLPLVSMSAPDDTTLSFNGRSLTLGWAFDLEGDRPYPGFNKLNAMLHTKYDELEAHLLTVGVSLECVAASISYTNRLENRSAASLAIGIATAWASAPSEGALAGLADYVGLRIAIEPKSETRHSFIVVGVDPGQDGVDAMLQLTVQRENNEQVGVLERHELLGLVHQQLINMFYASSNVELRSSWGEVTS